MILLIIAFILFEYKYKYNNSFLEYFNNIHNLKNINSNSNILTFPINIFSILASMIIRLISWRLKIELKIKNQEVPLQRIHRTLSGFYNFYFDLVRRYRFIRDRYSGVFVLATSTGSSIRPAMNRGTMSRWLTFPGIARIQGLQFSGTRASW